MSSCNYCIMVHAGKIGLPAIAANQSLRNTGTRTEIQKEAQEVTTMVKIDDHLPHYEYCTTTPYHSSKIYNYWQRTQHNIIVYI